MAKGKTPAERLRLAGRGYVQFALRNPQHLFVMFDLPSPAVAQVPEHADAGRRAFETLLDAIVAVQKVAQLPKGDPQKYAIASWSAVHGLAKLAIGGRLPFGSRQVLEFADYLTTALEDGMRQGNATIV